MALKVLIVDDNPATRFMIKEMLETNGHKMVAEAECLADTLKAYETHKPDVVTLDLSLVKEDGITILKALKKLDAKAKVLVITGNSQKKIHDQVMETGASGYLNKPFYVDELLDSLARLSQ